MHKDNLLNRFVWGVRLQSMEKTQSDKGDFSTLFVKYLLNPRWKATEQKLKHESEAAEEQILSRSRQVLPTGTDKHHLASRRMFSLKEFTRALTLRGGRVRSLGNWASDARACRCSSLPQTVGKALFISQVITSRSTACIRRPRPVRLRQVYSNVWQETRCTNDLRPIVSWQNHQEGTWAQCSDQ